MNADPMAAALALIRSLWPQTATWEPSVWQAWASALGDLQFDDLLGGIRRASGDEPWPSIAAIRRATLANRLAPPAAVALTDRSHPVAREVERMTREHGGPLGARCDDDDRRPYRIDEAKFLRLYRALAEEWNAEYLAGHELVLPGNREADAVNAAHDTAKAVAAGADPLQLVARLDDLALDELVENDWAFATGRMSRHVQWTADGDRVEPEWLAQAEVALATEGERRGRPWVQHLTLEAGTQ